MSRTTHTYAKLEVTEATWQEIADKLRAAGYDHAFHDGVIDMHGIGLQQLERHPEQLSEVSYRLGTEQTLRKLAKLVDNATPPGLGFVLVLATFGEPDESHQHMAYMSSIQRDTASRMLRELLGKWEQEGTVR